METISTKELCFGIVGTGENAMPKPKVRCAFVIRQTEQNLPVVNCELCGNPMEEMEFKAKGKKYNLYHKYHCKKCRREVKVAKPKGKIKKGGGEQMKRASK